MLPVYECTLKVLYGTNYLLFCFLYSEFCCCLFFVFIFQQMAEFFYLANVRFFCYYARLCLIMLTEDCGNDCE